MGGGHRVWKKILGEIKRGNQLPSAPDPPAFRGGSRRWSKVSACFVVFYGFNKICDAA